MQAYKKRQQQQQQQQHQQQQQQVNRVKYSKSGQPEMPNSATKAQKNVRLPGNYTNIKC